MTFYDEQRLLQEFNVLMRQQLEQAESRVPRLNELIDRIVSLELLTDLVLLSSENVQRPYGASTGPQDSGQVLQVAILVPGGVGLLMWDLEDYLRLRNCPRGLESEARTHFVPYSELSMGEKALLMFYASPLVTRLSNKVMALVKADDE